MDDTAAPAVVGFVGLGLMGTAMVERLLAAGRPVVAWNRSPRKLEAVVAAGARGAGSPAEVAAEAAVVFACVSDAHAVEAVLFGADGIAAAGGHGSLFVDHSSIRPGATRELAARLHDASGMGWVDAPVSGGVAGTRAGTLAVMAGGDPADVDRIRPIVAAYSQRCTLMGPLGSGQIAKLCNQVIVASTIAVIAEATNLARNAGIDAGRLPECLAGGWADSAPLQIFVPRMVDGYDEPIGRLGLFLKDVDAALDLQRATGSPHPMTDTVERLLRDLVARGHADDDAAVLADPVPEPPPGA